MTWECLICGHKNTDTLELCEECGSYKTKDVLLIKKLLGHSNIATTSRYLESLSRLDDHDMESYRKVFG